MLTGRPKEDSATPATWPPRRMHRLPVAAHPAVERMDTPEPQPFIPPSPRGSPNPFIAGRRAAGGTGNRALLWRRHRREASQLPRTLWGDIRATEWTLAVDRFPALEQRGAMVEQFRSLRSRLQEFRAMNRLQSLLVSSGVPQEGKSFIAANLAISLALHKSSRVLLIDGDMRRSTLQDYFGCAAHPGLSDYLSGKTEMIDVMQRPSAASTPNRVLRIRF